MWLRGHSRLKTQRCEEHFWSADGEVINCRRKWPTFSFDIELLVWVEISDESLFNVEVEREGRPDLQLADEAASDCQLSEPELSLLIARNNSAVVVRSSNARLHRSEHGSDGRHSLRNCLTPGK